MKSWIKGGLIGGIIGIISIALVWIDLISIVSLHNTIEIIKVIYFPAIAVPGLFCDGFSCLDIKMTWLAFVLMVIWSLIVGVIIGTLVGWLIEKIRKQKIKLTTVINLKARKSEKDALNLAKEDNLGMKRVYKWILILLGIFVLEFACLSLLDYEYHSYCFFGSECPTISPMHMIVDHYSPGGIDHFETLIWFLALVTLAHLLLLYLIYRFTPKKIKERVSKISKKKIIFILAIILLICLLWPKEYYSHGGEFCSEKKILENNLTRSEIEINGRIKTLIDWRGESGYCMGIIDNFREYDLVIGRLGKRCLGISIKTEEAGGRCK